MADPYKTLNVARDASQAAIRRAYLVLAKKHHPDLNPGDKAAEERFKKISAANELLSDKDRRARFDRGEIDETGQEKQAPPSYRDHAERPAGRRYGSRGAQSSGWSSADFSDLFGGAFHASGQGDAQEAEMRGHDLHAALDIAFLEAVRGATKQVSLPDRPPVNLKIPPGTEEGQVLRLRGQGEKGLGGPDGDLLIEIHVAQHDFFRREGQDIRLDLPITVQEAVLGALVDIPTPGGLVRMRVPAGSDGGTELRLRGRGVPAHGGHAAGNLHATLRIVIGPPDAALEAFLRGWVPEHPQEPRTAMEEA